MEFIDSSNQLVALVGFAEDGTQTTIGICTVDGIEKTSEVIFEGWPGTDTIVTYDVSLNVRPKGRTYYRHYKRAVSK